MCFGELLTQSKKKKTKHYSVISPFFLSSSFFFRGACSRSLMRSRFRQYGFVEIHFVLLTAVNKKKRKKSVVSSRGGTTGAERSVSFFFTAITVVLFRFQHVHTRTFCFCFSGKKALQLLQQLPEKTTKGEKNRPLWGEKSTRRRGRLSSPLKANRTKTEVSK